jgi:hypothetical protein
MEWIWVLAMECGLLDVQLGLRRTEEAVAGAREFLRGASATDEVTYEA